MIACGGTGGHLFPGIAIAEALVSCMPSASIVFAGTNRGLEGSLIPKKGWPLLSVGSMSIKDRKGLGRLLAYARLPFSTLQAMRLIRRERPQMFIGIGGYAAGPLTLAASLMKVPTAIVEPNAIAGFANRILGRFVARIYTGFPETAEFFPQKKVLLTGNPVREEIVAIKRSHLMSRDFLTIFCFGGSQGALALNRALISALPHLAGSQEKLRFIHQVGEHENIESVRRAYADHGFEAEVFPFTDRIWEFYERADLIICRAGAITVAELSVMGLPAIFIPYPYAADDHQRANAESLVRREAAVMILQQDLSGERLANEIKRMTKERLTAMAAASNRAGRPDAAKRIVEDCLRLISLDREIVRS
jgi:UDP-N-acetylglucosamine--N-acetylmuramyl-(pentapeptide) pyrophosphoryl-undecaprenol N-acetylglucosamine transferase